LRAHGPGMHAGRNPNGGLSEASSSGSALLSSKSSGVYEPDDAPGTIATLEQQCLRNAVVTWVVLPVWVVINACVTAWTFVCTAGFHDLTLLALVAIEVHHIYAEVCAWAAVKALLAPREIGVLRQLGVLRMRRRLVVLGVLEMLDLYTDLVFPFLARACMQEHGDVTQQWREAWRQVPVVGIVVAQVVKWLSFWGCSLFLTVGKVMLIGGVGIGQMFHHMRMRERQVDFTASGGRCPRISGEVFVTWADSAQTAMMPSVAHLCEEIALQRQYKLDLQGHGGSKDVRKAMEARFNSAFGKTTREMAAQLEIQDIREQEHIREVAAFEYVLMLIMTVFVGNVLQLWLQSSFFSLRFNEMGMKAKCKVLISMALSLSVALAHLKDGVQRGGTCGCMLSLFIFALLLLCCAKVYFVYHCPSHVWNLTTGCVEL